MEILPRLVIATVETIGIATKLVYDGIMSEKRKTFDRFLYKHIHIFTPILLITV